MRRRRTAAALLQQGLRARAQGRLADASSACKAVLQHAPEDPNALHLLGELAQGEHDLTAAETFFARALRSQPDLAATWGRLAEVQEDLGRPREAAASLRRVTELAPDMAQAHYNHARLLHQLGDVPQALGVLTQALHDTRCPPVLRAQMLQLQALLQQDAGQLDAALQTLGLAIEAQPQRAALHHNRGVLLQRLARPVEALAAHDNALALGLQAADAHYNRGNSLQSLGRTADALAAYRRALAADPQHALALDDLARLRWRLGDSDGFAAELDAAVAAAPAWPVAHGIKGRLLLRAGRYAEAVTAFASAIGAAPGGAGYFDGMGQALSRLGWHDEALAAHRRAVQLDPQQAATHIGLAACLLQTGDAVAAAAAAAMAVQLEPLHQQAWASLGLAWRASGDGRERWLNDYQNHVQVFDLAPPAGWPDAASFQAALAGALAPLHTDLQAPVDQSLRQGSQTLGDLFARRDPLLQQLQAMLASAVDAYIARLASLAPDRRHPLLGRLAAGQQATPWRFADAWSSRLGSGGFHSHHVHPHGWISSCLYVALPAAITNPAAGSAAQAGWLAFGEPDFTVPGCGMEARRVEQPRVGRLVLFPSFMWHGTRPFVDALPRLTVAFDVVPGHATAGLEPCDRPGVPPPAALPSAGLRG